METPINLYQAVEQMRKLTAQGETFSLKFRKWDRQRRRGGDLAVIPHARLRKKASDEQVAHSSHKLFFTDTDTGRARVCWQCLLIEFNGRKVIF